MFRVDMFTSMSIQVHTLLSTYNYPSTTTINKYQYENVKTSYYKCNRT